MKYKMKNGRYRHTSDRYHGHIDIELKETDKTIALTLIEVSEDYDGYDHFIMLIMLFRGRNRLILSKANFYKSNHAISLSETGKWFVIYPYRAGIPFAFDLVEEN